ncbi:MAG: hypothetical protein DRN20_00195 [Thermoplasmata archaeon]|nr:MAG: hypothetical protein DRN20_00195 [Thermoplasmata archaeon]
MERSVLIFYLTISSFYWAAAFILTKIALLWVPPVALAISRFLLAFIFLLPGLYIMDRSVLQKSLKVLKFRKKLYIPLAFFGISLPTVLQNIGMLYISASMSALIQSVGPALTATFAVVFLRESATLGKIAGGALAFFGALLLSISGHGVHSVEFLGSILILLSALCYAVSGVISKVCISIDDPQTVSLVEVFLGTLMLLPAIGIDFAIYHEISMASILYRRAMVSILLLALYSTAISIYIWYYALKKFELSVQAFYVYLIPVFAVLLGVLLLHDTFSPSQMLYSAMIIAGIYIVVRSSTAKP